MEILGITLFLLIVGHWLADYPLQGDFLAKAKQEGPLRLYHLIAHSGIHGGMVLVVTGSLIFGLIELIVHAIIDELKVKGKTSFALDQLLHIFCKFIYVILIGAGVTV